MIISVIVVKQELRTPLFYIGLLHLNRHYYPLGRVISGMWHLESPHLEFCSSSCAHLKFHEETFQMLSNS